MNAQELFQLIEKLKGIKDIDGGTALGSGFMGVVYLMFHLAIPHLFGLDYLVIVMIIGGLIGSGISRLFFNERRAKLQDFYIQKQITDEKMKFLIKSVELGLNPPTEAEKTAEKIINQFLLGEESIKSNSPNLTKQIEASDEE